MGRVVIMIQSDVLVSDFSRDDFIFTERLSSCPQAKRGCRLSWTKGDLLSCVRSVRSLIFVLASCSLCKYISHRC